MFKKAYVEITNRCNLRCSFCPGTKRAARTMTLEEFTICADALKGRAEYIYLHVMGEPLTHPELRGILKAAGERGFRVCVTTNGTLLPKRGDDLLSDGCLYKVSVSLHSIEGSGCEADMRAYLAGVWAFCERAQERGVYCALRLWNGGGSDSRNGEILSFLEEKLGYDPLSVRESRNHSRSFSKRLFLECEDKFDWPDIAAPETGAQYCLGLRNQIGVLADGTVVPCCLDHDGDIALGNIYHSRLGDILASKRAEEIYDGFSARRPSEELCRRCGFATRFNK
jgi:radical SAM protein with 4Fe4S-binding SPASM domain